MECMFHFSSKKKLVIHSASTLFWNLLLSICIQTSPKRLPANTEPTCWLRWKATPCFAYKLSEHGWKFHQFYQNKMFTWKFSCIISQSIRHAVIVLVLVLVTCTITWLYHLIHLSVWACTTHIYNTHTHRERGGESSNTGSKMLSPLESNWGVLVCSLTAN